MKRVYDIYKGAKYIRLKDQLGYNKEAEGINILSFGDEQEIEEEVFEKNIELAIKNNESIIYFSDDEKVSRVVKEKLKTKDYKILVFDESTPLNNTNWSILKDMKLEDIPIYSEILCGRRYDNDSYQNGVNSISASLFEVFRKKGSRNFLDFSEFLLGKHDMKKLTEREGQYFRKSNNYLDWTQPLFARQLLPLLNEDLISCLSKDGFRPSLLKEKFFIELKGSSNLKSLMLYILLEELSNFRIFISGYCNAEVLVKAMKRNDITLYLKERTISNLRNKFGNEFDLIISYFQVFTIKKLADVNTIQFLASFIENDVSLVKEIKQDEGKSTFAILSSGFKLKM